MYNERELTEIYQRQVRTVYAVALSHGLQHADCEDITHECFIRLLKSKTRFHNNKHEKAWFIVTSGNLCKNLLKSKNYQQVEIQEWDAITDPRDQTDDVFRAVLQLPERLRLPVHLFYYEGYKSREIAEFLARNESTVRNQLAEARALLKDILGGKYAKRI